MQLKGVDFTKGIGTLMQGTLKVPKVGGVKKGWQEHFVFLSNARLFVCPIVDSKPSLVPVQVVDIRDPQFTVCSVTEADVIHASKKDIPCIMKMVVPKLKNSSLKQKLLLFCAKDEKDKNNWINVLRDLNDRLFQSSSRTPIGAGSTTSSAGTTDAASITSLMVFYHSHFTTLFYMY